MRLLTVGVVDPDKPDVQLRVREAGEDKTLTVPKTCHVSVNGLDARWADLRPGDQLTVWPGRVLADRCERED